MIRSSVTASLVPEARGGPFIFWDDLPAACKKAKALGFDAIEVFPPSADAVDPHLLRTSLNDNGLALAAVGTGAGWVKHRLTFCLPDASTGKRRRHSPDPSSTSRDRSRHQLSLAPCKAGMAMALIHQLRLISSGGLG